MFEPIEITLEGKTYIVEKVTQELLNKATSEEARKDLLKRRVIAERLNWVSIEGIDRPLKVEAKIRYNNKKAKEDVTKLNAATVEVKFDEPQSAPTPGQAVVFYNKDVVVGGGWIRVAH